MSFKKNLGNIAAPIKKNANAIISVSAKLIETEFRDNARNAAKTTRTTNGLNMWFFKTLLFFMKLKKFSSGYKLLKKLFTHWSSINAIIENIVVNRNDL